jgi:hypothetical protein
MKNDDGFIYEDSDALSDEDKKVIMGLKHRQRIDPVTGRKQKRLNVLNKKNLSREELDDFLTEEMRLDF